MIGQTLSHYKILEEISRGGMGVVYRALDVRLRREVAIKVLPAEVTSHPERRNRFLEEARAAAALDHPNIAVVHDIGDADGVIFIAMELVRGEKLRDVLERSPLSVERMLEISMEIAEGLGRAHEKGIVHRDLKPANVMLTEDGHAKIIDFGLAKLIAPSAGEPSELETSFRMNTEPGILLGTVSYMSPEQANGAAIDHRSDIFSFGVVLYEMLAGRLPFQGSGRWDTIRAITSESAPRLLNLAREVGTDAGSELQRMLDKCLAKEPARRYQTMKDLVVDLRAMRERIELTGSRPRVSAARPWALPRSVAAGVVLVVLAGVGFFFGMRARNVSPPHLSFTQLTSELGIEVFPSFTPDGGFVAYASRSSGNWDVSLLRVGGQRAINLTADSPAHDSQPAISPDGSSIAFHSSRDGGGLFLMGATGENVRRLTTYGWNPTWSPDGQEIAFASVPIFEDMLDRPTRSSLSAVRVETGATRLLVEGDAVQPSWSPHGHRIAYWGRDDSGQRDVWTVPAEGGEPRAVTRDQSLDWSPAWSSDGRHLYYSSDRGGSMNLWSVRIEEETGETVGEPQPVTVPSPFAAHLAISSSGERMVYTSFTVEISLQRADCDPEATPFRCSWTPRPREVSSITSVWPSPDGKWLVATSDTPQEDILLLRADGTEERRLTDDPHRDRIPRWSPDGRQIAFYSNRSGSYQIWTIDVDGRNLTQWSHVPERNFRYPFWSPDGSRIMASSPGMPGLIFQSGRAWSEQTPQTLPAFESSEREFVPVDWSPDGQWIAGHLQSMAGREGIAVYSFEKGTYEQLTEFGQSPYWLNDSRRVLFQGREPPSSSDEEFFQQEESLYLVDRVTKELLKILDAEGASLDGGSALSADNRHLFFSMTTTDADLWMIRFEGQ